MKLTSWKIAQSQQKNKKKGQYAPVLLVSKTKEGGLSPLMGQTFSFNTVLCHEAAAEYSAGCSLLMGGMMASAMEKTWPSVFLLSG